MGGAKGNPYTNGFNAAIAGTNIKVVSSQPGDWDRLKATKVAQNMLTAFPDITVLFVHNEDMAKGVAQVLKDAGRTDVAIVSQNGSEIGEEMIASGELEATSAWSPTINGMLIAQKCLDLLNGKEVEKRSLVEFKVITKDNLADLDPWDLTKLLKKLGKA